MVLVSNQNRDILSHWIIDIDETTLHVNSQSFKAKEKGKHKSTLKLGNFLAERFPILIYLQWLFASNGSAEQATSNISTDWTLLLKITGKR